VSGFPLRWSFARDPSTTFQRIGDLAVTCLKLEVATYPKPGLVSHVDNGAHRDMNAALLNRSSESLRPYFAELAAAGAGGAGMERLRAIGIAAEGEMLRATGGVNTHRGAIFGMGLLCAAAGFRTTYAANQPLGSLIAQVWGAAILNGPQALRSHGAEAARRYHVGGARAEAAHGLPAVYRVALPALRRARDTVPADAEALRVQVCMELIAHIDDTNLLHRGGLDGLSFARERARAFLGRGGIAAADWRADAAVIHREFITRNLSPGGCADLLAMTLFVDRMEP
jgi:triphosphoribosyl-dephospho-CoA synthase